MRYLRLAVSLLFIVSLVLTAFSTYKKVANSDSSMPVIEGSSQVLQIPCEYTAEDLMSGITAYDEKDGDLTDEIIIGNFTSFYDKGKCNLSYAVFDSSNHPATFSRKVEFTDYHSPHFDISDPLIFKEDVTSRVSDNFSAYDIFDGDVSSEIRVSDLSVDFTKSGKYYVKAEVMNSFGDFVSMEFPVYVVQKIDTAYDIGLKKNIVYLNEGDEFRPESMIDTIIRNDGTAVDYKSLPEDKFVINSNVDTSAPGLYEVRYSYFYAEDKESFTFLTVIVE